jgi:RNA polymerase sigma factor for flagellar operon FliA
VTNHHLIEAHLPLVTSVVHQVAGGFPSHVDRGELAAAGRLGLVDAAHRFNPALGVPFERYASRRIRGAILDNVRAADWAPRSVRRGARRLESAQQRLATDLGRAPTRSETAAALDMTAEALATLQERMSRSVVLALEYKTADSDEDLTLADVVADETTLGPADELAQAELHSTLNDAVAELAPKHRAVIIGMFAGGRSQTALAARMGVTPSRVCQLYTEAIVMLRDGINAQYVARPTRRPVGRVERRQDRYAAAIRAARPWPDRLHI